MTERVPTPDRIVGEIKSIIYQDKRERLAAGFRYGSRGLARRIAKAYGLSYYTVFAIKVGRRRKSTYSLTGYAPFLTVDDERLKQLREYNERTRPGRGPVRGRYLKYYARLGAG
jgi:hypothetical protein